MEQIYIGKKIAELRKQNNLTQEELAKQLSVSNQAVSKWESDQCYPDITLLPEIAQFFNISLDELFGLNPAKQYSAKVNDLPWPDNDDLHAVLYQGHQLLDYCKNEINTVLRFSGTCDDINSSLSVILENSEVNGDINAGTDVHCGDVDGDINAGTDVHCGDVNGDVNAGRNIDCRDIEGDVNAGVSITCNNIEGDADALTITKNNK